MSSRSFSQIVDLIRDDNTSGATEIAKNALRAITSDLVPLDNQNLNYFFLKRARLLISTHPEMTILDSVLREFFLYLEHVTEQVCVENLEQIIYSNGERVLEAISRRERQTIENLSKYLENYHKILTLSWSSTIFKSLQKLKEDSANIKRTIIVAESRPLFEGRKLAIKLSKLGYQVDIIADAAIGHFIGKVEIGVSGADAVYVDGSIVNKIGTYFLSLCCRDFKPPIPFIVGTTTDKFSYPSLSESFTPVSKKYPPEELFENWEENKVIPQNEYFETVPERLISAMVTENGVIATKIRENVKKTLLEKYPRSVII